jgi:beta-aspartyl-peptidase (threonine type)
MKTLLPLLILFFVLSGYAQTKQNYALVIHGGAGVMVREKMPEDVQKKYVKTLDKALRKGDSILAHGGKSLDAVEQVIRVLEDSPLFNAGRGAVLAHDGTAQLDASIMQGADLSAGAVCGVKEIKNPISAARAVMEHSEHVFLSGNGASDFARQQGLEMVRNSYFITEKQKNSLNELLKKEREQTINDKHGTVGCVALDTYGNITAGTSTGGMINKKFGRIGDSPVIGAGTYANNQTCGVSCTGHGEYYIRLGFARDVSALMEYRQLTVQQACRAEIDKLSQIGGTGGVIALDRQGNIAMEFNTPGMFRAYSKSSGEKFIGIFND